MSTAKPKLDTLEIADRLGTLASKTILLALAANGVETLNPARRSCLRD